MLNYIHNIVSPLNPTLIYFHGGGLITGTNKDYPSLYEEELKNRNINFISFNYPLAPAVGVRDIHKHVFQCIRWFVERGYKTLGLETNRYFLMGRSAGAYLALYATKNLRENKLPYPEKLILFYGYENFDVKEFRDRKSMNPVLNYRHISSMFLERKDDDPLFHRSLIYLYARQQGVWLDYIQCDEEIRKEKLHHISEDDFPATFLAASSSDDDVPYSCTLAISSRIKNSKLVTVYELPHEFDNQIRHPLTVRTMATFFQWLES